MEDNEKRFEEDIETWLSSPAGGWIKTKFQDSNYDATKGLDLYALLTYVQETQSKMWERYKKVVGVNPESSFSRDLNKKLITMGFYMYYVMVCRIEAVNLK